MTARTTCQVLVVGLGPVGATLAALLGDAGVRVLAIDKSTEVYPLPRAAHFDHEIMRVFQQLGIARALHAHARVAPGYEFRTPRGEVLLEVRSGGDRLAPSGWAQGYMFNQPGLEALLRAKLEDSPSVEVWLGAEFTALRQAADLVAATIRTPAGEVLVEADYVVGCDGAWSPVREAMGGGLVDLKFDEPWLVLDALPRTGCRLPEVNLQICDPARPTTCVQMGPGRHRWEFMLLPGETPEHVLDDAFIQALLAPWNVDVEIERKAVYRFHGLVAERWREGRALIAGDAAHQTPPFAGQGMCAGIRDAANLAWKLTQVLQDRASPRLLDTYQLEREPNVRAYIELAIGMGRVVCTLDPQEARARDEQMLAARAAGIEAVPPAAPPPFTGPAILAGAPGAGEMFPQAVQRDGEQASRLDDVLGAGPWLISRTSVTAPAGQQITLAAFDDPRLAPFRAALDRWLAARGVEAVLVRPDRCVFGSGSPDRLLDAWARALGASAPPDLASAPSSWNEPRDERGARLMGGDGGEARELSVREALVRAGQALFSEHPVDAVAIDDIVGAAKVAKGSFYKHFPDKETLLSTVVARIRDRIERQVASANAGVDDPAQRVARAICVYLRFVADEPERGGVLVRNGRSGQTLASLDQNQGTVDDVRAGLAAGRFALPSAEAGVLFILGVGYAGLTRFVGQRGAESNIWIAQQLCQLTLRGLGLSLPEAELIAAQAAEDLIRAPASLPA